MKIRHGLTVVATVALLSTSALGFANANVVSADDLATAKTQNTQILADLQAAQAKVDTINNSISDKVVAIQNAQVSIDTTTTKIAENGVKIAAAKKELKARKVVMKKQLKSLQKEQGDSVTGNVYFDFLLNSDNISDAIARVSTVTKLNKANTDAADAVQTAQDDLTKLVANQTATKQKLVDTQNQLVADQASLETQKVEATAATATLDAQLEANKATIASLEAQAAQAASAAQAATAAGTAAVGNGGASGATAPSTGVATGVATHPSSSSAMVNVAYRYLGTPYVYGGSSPAGFDCSGLVWYVGQQAGISLPRTSQTQANAGQRISLSQLQPGDLVIFGADAHHVGIYIGGGAYIHSPKPGDVVKIAYVQYYTPSYGVRL